MFAGIVRPEEFTTVTRAHIIAWRDELARRALGGNTIPHRLSALASLFEYLCEKNAVTHNPAKDVERPKVESGDFRHVRKGVPHLKVPGEGGKTRYVPLHYGAMGLVTDYIDLAGHSADDNGALFRPVKTTAARAASNGRRCLQAGARLPDIAGVSDRRSCAARNGRHQRSTTRPIMRRCRNAGPREPCDDPHYDPRRTRPEDSPTFKVAY